MEKRLKALEYRKRFDGTLASFELGNEESVKEIVKNQLLRSSLGEIEGDIENVVQKKTVEVWNFLETLRSASRNGSEVLETHGTSQNDWKLKQDNDQMRVMYREGLQGTPFHTLLAEGYVDGPIDVCLCVSWESALYPKWWPQFNIPPFKVITSTCLKKVRIGEEISLVRVKVPWPLSTREAVVHYFLLEYFEDDLIIVLINTVPDSERLDVNTHGFTRDGIPEPNDTTRIDLVGGFALQRVNSNRSYFRTILTADIKFDFVPPWIINFMARQLMGSGFKLYQKAVVSAAKGNEDFRKTLEGPMYARLREGLRSFAKTKDYSEVRDNEKPITHLLEENTTEIKKNGMQITHRISVKGIEEDDIEPATSSEMDHNLKNDLQTTHRTCVSEIEEDDAEPATCSEIDQNQNVNKSSISTIVEEQDDIDEMAYSATNSVIKQCHVNEEKPDSSTNTNIRGQYHHISKERDFISPEVERALDMLGRAISLIRGHGWVGPLSVQAGNTRKASTSSQESPDLEMVAASGLASDGEEVCVDGHDAPETKMESMDKPSSQAANTTTSNYFRSSQGPDSHKAEQTQTAPSWNQNLPSLEEVLKDGLSSSPNLSGSTFNRSEETPESHSLGKVYDEDKANRIRQKNATAFRDKAKEKKRHRLCCLSVF